MRIEVHWAAILVWNSVFEFCTGKTLHVKHDKVQMTIDLSKANSVELNTKHVYFRFY